MSAIVAVILGLVQGLSEFIPISSTAHLTLAGSMFDVIDPSQPEKWTAFMATIQLGTLAAVMIYFWKDITSTTVAFLRENLGRGRRSIKEQSAESRMGWLVIISTIPIVVFGLVFKDFIEGSFTKELPVIAAGLIGVAVLIWIADRRATFQKKTEDITMKDAIWIGFAQCLALIPGSSRSGTTIMAGLFRGLNREHAARFSFLMSIPAIFGAGVLEFLSHIKDLSWQDGGSELLIATVVSGISGYLSIAMLLRYLRTHSMNIFVGYRIALGAVILLTSCSPQPETADTRGQGTTALHETLATTVDTAVVPSVTTDSSEITNTVLISTSMGKIKIGLYGNEAPLTTKNFLALVKRRFYDKTRIHRVSKNFVVQLGDPLTRDLESRAEWGQGGATASGEILPEELNVTLPSAQRGYERGVVAMARKPAAGTGTSQFFICLEKAKPLPYQYTIFGRVLDGMGVVDSIANAEVTPGLAGEHDGIPIEPIRVLWVRKR